MSSIQIQVSRVRKQNAKCGFTLYTFKIPAIAQNKHSKLNADFRNQNSEKFMPVNRQQNLTDKPTDRKILLKSY